MCLSLFAYDSHPIYRLVLAHNRDEFYRRPTRPAHFWPAHPELLAGQDEERGGTWLGITRGGRISFVTNYRDPLLHRDDTLSRGSLVRDFLTSSLTPADAMAAIDVGSYNDFNLVGGNNDELRFLSSRVPAPGSPGLSRGIHSLSNGSLDSEWPKERRGRRRFAELLQRGPSIEALFGLMRDETPAPDAELPATGIGIERERALSPVFVRTPDYGTVSTTVILWRRDGAIRFTERSYRPTTGWRETGKENFRIVLSSPA